MAYTNIDDPSAYFQVKKWTGNAGTNAITLDGNSDMRPDFMWHKEQNDTNGWHQFDSSRGVTKYLASQSTAAEGTFSGYLTSFDSNGFTAGSGDSSMNSSGTAQCSWMWHCNAGTTSSNTDGNITSTVQSNQDAGFSIVTYTGNGSNNQTIGHGLGVQPSWWVVKNRSGGSTNWLFGASSILGGTSNYLKLNDTSGNTEYNNIWGDSPTSSTLFRVSNVSHLNTNGSNYVAYLFANRQGYSKFGSYVGNGSTNGTFVYTGFKPAFVMWKQTNSARNWAMMDSARDPFNEVDQMVWADLSNAESTVTTDDVDFLSNGFKMRGAGATTNESGGSYIYMAFAESPFTTSTGIPTTAR